MGSLPSSDDDRLPNQDKDKSFDVNDLSDDENPFEAKDGRTNFFNKTGSGFLNKMESKNDLS